MLGIPARYFLKHPITTVADIAADPLQLWMTIQDEYAARREASKPNAQYESDDDWEQRLHESFGAPWPCPAAAEFWTVWPQRSTPNWKRKGLSPVRRAFNGGMTATRL